MLEPPAREPSEAVQGLQASERAFVMQRVFVALTLALLGCRRGDAPAPSDAGRVSQVKAREPSRTQLRASFDAADAGALEAHLSAVGADLALRLKDVAPSDAGVEAQLESFVSVNLAEKRAAGFPLEVARVRREVIDYEAFKLETFVRTGVFPKRYFGYLDERWDTAPYEVRLKRAATAAATACNAWLAGEHDALRVDAQEIVVTFLAEGGAMLLRERQDQLEHIHPVRGIGLDDIAKGFDELEPLIKRLDATVGTHLEQIVVRDGDTARLGRTFTFEEAVAGTAAMWVWEKRIAEQKLKQEGRPSLTTRARDEQFVITSLVYNSGILFNQRTIDELSALRLGPYLFELSEKSKSRKWALPVEKPEASLARLVRGDGYPDQRTSWSAVYHVVQRYGAWVALSRFTDDFDEQGALR